MIAINEFIPGFYTDFPLDPALEPWMVTQDIIQLIQTIFPSKAVEYEIDDQIAIHRTAVIETGAVVKGPAIIGPGCFIAAHAYLRGGVVLGKSVKIGTGCEIKGSFICSRSAIAHFNFIGDSIVGNDVNFEAGAITANHYNERTNKRILVAYRGQLVDTGVEKFGALIGDGSRVGANAVLSPGTLLPRRSIVNRLQLINQQDPGS